VFSTINYYLNKDRYLVKLTYYSGLRVLKIVSITTVNRQPWLPGSQISTKINISQYKKWVWEEWVTDCQVNPGEFNCRCNSFSYSALRLFTGFATAALNAR
jgi:hypothetical protein